MYDNINLGILEQIQDEIVIFTWKLLDVRSLGIEESRSEGKKIDVYTLIYDWIISLKKLTRYFS